jgi:hypothetical protein
VIKIFLEEHNNYIKRFLCVSNGINNYSNNNDKIRGRRRAKYAI